MQMNNRTTAVYIFPTWQRSRGGDSVEQMRQAELIDVRNDHVRARHVTVRRDSEANPACILTTQADLYHQWNSSNDANSN